MSSTTDRRDAGGVAGPTRARIEARTLRTDRWWVYPAVTFVVFSGFIVFATYRAFVGKYFYSEPYMSPFFSPCIAHACDGKTTLPIIADWWRLSPALVILIFPLGFRMTCYYYRKAYYRGFWLSPPACAVAEPHGSYTGETRLPLILQNIHRYFWYAAVVVALVLSYDTVLTFRDENGDWGHMGLGSLVFLANIACIWAYTLGCHSCRHITGGRLRHFSKHPIRYRAWTLVSKLNAKHAMWAWVSLFSVAIADFYVYLLATGHIEDWRFF